MKKASLVAALTEMRIAFLPSMSVIELKELHRQATMGTDKSKGLVRKKDPMAGLDRYTKAALLFLSMSLCIAVRTSATKGLMLLGIRARLQELDEENLQYGQFKDHSFKDVSQEMDYVQWTLDQGPMKAPRARLFQWYLRVHFRGQLNTLEEEAGNLSAEDSDPPTTKVEKEEPKKEMKKESMDSHLPSKVKVEKTERLPKGKKLDPVEIPIHTSSESEEDRSHKKKAVRPEDLPEDSTSAQSWMELGEKRKNRPSKARSSRG